MTTDAGIIDNRLEIQKIRFAPNKQPVWETNFGDVFSTCIRCTNPRCQYYSDDELHPIDKRFTPFPIDRDPTVCLTGALSWEKGNATPIINAEKCILCGVCISRCPVGAIFFSEEGAKVSSEDNMFVKFERGIQSDKKHKIQVERLNDIQKYGCMLPETEEKFVSIYKKILEEAHKSYQFPNLLTRNLINAIGNRCYIRRRGDVYLRTDGLLESTSRIGVTEVEFQSDVMGSPRSILDDIAVLSSRYGISKEELFPLIVSLEFPNMRTE